MGFYVGPYFECNNRGIAREERFIACGNSSCPKHNKPVVLFNYCPICGQRVEPVSRMIEPRPTYASTVRDLVGEKLIYANMADDGLIHRWTPDYTNRNDDPVRNRGICLNECFSLRIRDVKIEDERNWLSCYFANEMTILLREYGKENVTIEWGILGYCE